MNLKNIFPTTKVIGISFQTRLGSKLLGLNCNIAILKQIICLTFVTLNLKNKRFNELTQKRKDNLPRIYCNSELLPKPKSGKYIVSIHSLIQKFGSFCGIVLEIKQIVNFSRWNSAWLVLIPDSHLWFTILNISWKN